MRILIIFTLLVTLTLTEALNIKTTVLEGAAAVENADILSPFIKIGKKFYWIQDELKINWFEAAHICRTKGAQLATIESEEESQALSAHLISKNYTNWFWMGANDLGQEGHFYWIGTGQPVTYTKWAINQPDNGFGGENCVNLWRTANEYTWNDNTCTNTCLFICEVQSPRTISVTIW